MEILGQAPDAGAVLNWISGKLPPKWYETKGLWYTYYVTALAECGIDRTQVSPEHLNRAFERVENAFAYGCEDFMLLRALVMLGFHAHTDGWCLDEKTCHIPALISLLTMM